MAYREIILMVMKFLYHLFEYFDFYGYLAYVRSVLFWCFRCQLEHLHRYQNVVTYCKYCLMSCWIKFVISLNHCEKSFCIRSYFDLHFPVFGLNKQRNSVSLCIQSKCGKKRTRVTPNTNTF